VEPFDLYRVRGAKRGWVQKHGSRLVEMFRVIDGASIIMALWMAVLQLNMSLRWDFVLIAICTVLLYEYVAKRFNVYRSWRASPLHEELWRVACAWFVTVMILASLWFMLNPSPQEHRGLMQVWGAIALPMLLSARLLIRLPLRFLRRSGANFRTAAIVGATAAGHEVAKVLRGSAWMGVNVIGVYDDRRPEPDRTTADFAISGDLNELRSRIDDGQIDIVYVALPLRAEFRIRALIEELRDAAVSVQFVADFSALGLLNPRWEILAGIPTVTVIDTPHQGVDGLLKRTVDVIGSSLALLLLALPMAVIAACIRLDSPGPVIFRQRRYGLDGREFEIYKFRTMTVAASAKSEFVQASRKDARVTRLGALLRRTSLDELPQFINVLQGRMSIVGPRPHPIALDESQRRLIDGYRLRHKVRPGITGWAQVNGMRGETDTQDKMLNRIRFDLEYIDGWSLWLDLKIMGMTARQVLRDPQAY
jgi:putative colanic acid biosynthesis UDP-glucose lipid carrier transferase